MPEWSGRQRVPDGILAEPEMAHDREDACQAQAPQSTTAMAPSATANERLDNVDNADNVPSGSHHSPDTASTARLQFGRFR